MGRVATQITMERRPDSGEETFEGLNRRHEKVQPLAGEGLAYLLACRSWPMRIRPPSRPRGER